MFGLDRQSGEASELVESESGWRSLDNHISSCPLGAASSAVAPSEDKKEKLVNDLLFIDVMIQMGCRKNRS